MFPRSVIVISLIAAGVLTAPAQQSVAWKDAMKQPRDWYGSAEAVRVAGQLLLYQHDNGGWEKNLDMAAPLSDQQRGDLLARKKENLGHTTIDNDATYTQMRYLARTYTTTRVSAGIKHPHYCRFRRLPPGRGRGRYSTPDSKLCLAEPRCRRYYRACANWSSSRGRNVGGGGVLDAGPRHSARLSSVRLH